MRLALVMLGAIAHIAWAGDGSPLAVTVGFTVERSVGNANGWFCDDPSLVEAALETRGDENVWVVKGVKPGTTQCRVGTDIARASYVVDVTVKAGTTSKPSVPTTAAPKPAAPTPKPAATTAKPPVAAAKPIVKKPRAKRRPRKPKR